MMRISLSEKCERAINKLKSDSANRKLSKEAWVAIVSEALLSVPQSVWREQIERHTPPSYLIDQALRDPKLAKQMTDFLRAKMNPKDEVVAVGED